MFISDKRLCTYCTHSLRSDSLSQQKYVSRLSTCMAHPNSLNCSGPFKFRTCSRVMAYTVRIVSNGSSFSFRPIFSP